MKQEDNRQRAWWLGILETPAFWAAACAVALQQAGIALLTSTYIESASAVLEYESLISLAFSLMLCVALYQVVSRKPQSIRDALWTVMGVAGNTAGVLLMWVASSIGSAALVVVAGCLRGAGGVWLMYMVGLMLVGLAAGKGTSAALFSLGLGWLLAIPLEALASTAPSEGQLVILLAIYLTLAVVAYPGFHGATLAARSSQASADARVTAPGSFIPLGSAVFIMLVLLKASFCFASNFTRTNVDSRLPTLHAVIVLVAFVCLMTAIAAHKNVVVLNSLYKVTLVFVLAGFLLYIPAALGTSPVSIAAGFVLGSGGDLSRVLAYLLLIQISQRNAMDAPGVSLFVAGANTAGSLLGYALSDAAAALSTDVISYQLLLVGFTMAIIILNLAIPRAFALDEIVQEVVPFAEPPKRDEQASFADAVFAVARAHALTPREIETLGLLARGHGAQEIEQRMGISRNTVKMHVRNVYAKLDVHSQQDVINLIESQDIYQA